MYKSTTISISPTPVDKYWARMEQVGIGDEYATLEEVSDILDTAFNIDPCNDEDKSNPEVIPEDDFDKAVSEIVKYPICDANENGDLEVSVKLILSHIKEPYKLNLERCELLSTSVVEEDVTIDIKIDTNEVELPYPLLGKLTSSIPFVGVNGNTAIFSNAHIGNTANLKFHTSYYLLTINVFGNKGERGSGNILCFYHGMVEELDTEVPELDELDNSKCPETKFSLSTDGKATCFKVVNVTEICSCSKQVVNTYQFEEDCPCNKEYKCDPGNDTCRIHVGSKEVTNMVQCIDDSTYTGTGGYTNNVSKISYYQDTCCELPDFALPDCDNEVLDYKGSEEIEHGEDFYKELYGEDTEFIPILPDNGRCGRLEIIQQVSPINCCEGVSPIVFDMGITPYTMSPSSVVHLAITGGVGPYTWIISGHGVSVYGTGSNAAITIGRDLYIQANSDACGWVSIIVNDSCFGASHGIRVSQGAWVEVGSFGWSSDEYPFPMSDVLERCVQGVIVSDVYLGYTEDGYSSRISPDGRYWIGGGTALPANNPIVPGSIGVPFQYGGAYQTFGVPIASGCLDGCAPLDPLVGVFNPIMATGCFENSGGIYSRTPTSPIYIFEWSC